MASELKDFTKVTLHEVTENNDDQRLDNFLLGLLKGVPKSRIYKLIRKGEIRVNKKRAKPDQRLVLEDIVRIAPIRLAEKKDIEVSANRAEKLKACIIYEDRGLIVLNKPSGLAVHGGSGISSGVIEVLRTCYDPNQFLELVHRLDRDTSGLLLLAKKRSILRALHEQLQNGGVKKHYWALVAGRWRGAEMDVDAPLKKNTTKSGERLVRVSSERKASKTRFKILDRYSEFTLMQAYPITGRTHQIRVHAQHEGHPIIGDEKYGDKEMNKKGKESGIRRLFLHAKELSFELPDQGVVHFEAPLESSLVRGLEKLAK